MNVTKPFKFVFPLVLILPIGWVPFQAVADDAADVILVIEEQWEAEQKGDEDWLDEMLHHHSDGLRADIEATVQRLLQEQTAASSALPDGAARPRQQRDRFP